MMMARWLAVGERTAFFVVTGALLGKIED